MRLRRDGACEDGGEDKKFTVKSARPSIETQEIAAFFRSMS